jgi:undecaprenyl-phosphate 4-deoxy-4-formamido-L-arabinose transferase
MKPVPSLSAVVPVYNSEGTLLALVDELARVLPGIARRWEVILVNDGSQDGSWTVLESLAARHPEVKVVDLSRNFGQHAALLCGVRRASGELVVTLDDDLQHPPEEIPCLLKALTADVDVVYGRACQDQHEVWRRLGSGAVRWALSVTVGQAVAREASAFRLFRTRVRDAFSDFRGPYVSLDVLLSWGSRGSRVVEVAHHARAQGRSNYTLRHLVGHALDVITGFSSLPLQLASLLGLAATLFGVGVLIYVVGRYFIEGGGVPGFPFLASIISIFAGVQLLTLGVFGQYLGRIHQRALERPAYVVRDSGASGDASPEATPRAPNSPL